MRYNYLVGFLLVCTFVQAQIVNIPDANFKNALVNTVCADFNGDLDPEDDADTNNDGEIQLSEAQAVLGLVVTQQNIASLEGIQSFTNIGYLNVWQNQLTTLDVTQLPNLHNLFCPDNQITAIDVSQNANLEQFICWENNLTSLDVSQNPELFRFSCRDNELLNLNVQNGNNTNFVLMWAHNNSNLECIQVDDPSYSNGASGWMKDTNAEYSTLCTLVGVDDFSVEKISIYPNPSSNLLNVHTNSPIDVIKIYSAQGKLIQEHTVSSIDISQLNAGIYFVQIEVDGRLITKKFIKT